MTYEYVCTACSHQWEAEQSISEPPLTTCPVCHKETAKRQVSGGQGFILKGGGWYADGYGSKGAASASSTTTPTKKESSTTTDTSTSTPKTDTKPASSNGSSSGGSST
jgi:putative FmdB family regulatory protein